MIEIIDLHKSFGRLEVLKGIGLHFKDHGKITAILGPNGSGKTTLIKCLLGMVIPSRGTIKVQNEDIKRNWTYRNQIDYLPQMAHFPENLTLKELIAFIKDLRGKGARDSELIRLFGLEPYLDKRLHNLSGGTKQKVNLTLALLYDSPVMILDEPTNGLDPLTMVHFREVLSQEKAKGKIILITTHIMSLVEEIADEVVFLLEGRIHFEGSIGELKARYNETSVERAIAQVLSGKQHVVINSHTVADPSHLKTITHE